MPCLMQSPWVGTEGNPVLLKMIWDTRLQSVIFMYILDDQYICDLIKFCIMMHFVDKLFVCMRNSNVLTLYYKPTSRILVCGCIQYNIFKCFLWSLCYCVHILTQCCIRATVPFRSSPRQFSQVWCELKIIYLDYSYWVMSAIIAEALNLFI